MTERGDVVFGHESWVEEQLAARRVPTSAGNPQRRFDRNLQRTARTSVQLAHDVIASGSSLMVFVWRGMGLGVLLGGAAVGFGLALFVFDDPKMGNLSWLGWTCIGTAVISLLLGLATFGGEDEDSGWTKHHVFFIPVLLWPLILGAAGGWCLMNYDPPSNHLQGEWVAKRCYGACPEGTMETLEGFTLKITEDSVADADAEPRAFEIEKDEDSIVLWRYTDDDSTELIRILGPDEVVGQFDGADGTKFSVAFERASGS